MTARSSRSGAPATISTGCNTNDYNWTVTGERFDVDALDEDSPFEIDRQVAHLFKHPYLGVDDIWEVWVSRPLFYPARPPAHWLMVAEVDGRVLVVPLAPSTRATSVCRPIGCYPASEQLARQYKEDR